MNKTLKITMLTFGSIMLLLTGAWSTWYMGGSLRPTDSQLDTPAFKGSILAASDADMIATAYADGVLNKVEGIEDSLSLISFSTGQPTVESRIHASNSVISWPSIIAWNAPKQYAYLAETRGIYRAESQKVADVWQDMPDGSLITVVDYKDHSAPKVIQRKAVGENIQGVSLNHDQTLLVAGSTEKGKEMVVAALKDGLIDQTHYFTHDEIDERPSNSSGIRTIEFHPEENIIAANLNNTHLVFFRVVQRENELKLEQIGHSIEVAKHWSVGNWHPSGRYFILTDVAWGEGSAGYIFNRKGQLVSVAYDPKGDHQIVSSARVGLSPEGFDLSPDGKYAVVANMRRTYGPKSFWFVPARRGASLSLVKINPETGGLQTLGRQYGFEGALPEDAIFDEESNTVAVAVYHQQDESFPTRGWVDFWELKDDQLIKTRERVYLTRGVHNLLLIK